MPFIGSQSGALRCKVCCCWVPVTFPGPPAGDLKFGEKTRVGYIYIYEYRTKLGMTKVVLRGSSRGVAIAAKR